MADDTHLEPRNPVAPVSQSAQSWTVEVVPGHLRMHTLSEDKLEMLVAGNAPIHLTFFGICLGAVISFGIVLYNGGLDSAHQLVYQCFLFLSAIMAAYFGLRGGTDYVNSRRKLSEIKRRKISN